MDLPGVELDGIDVAPGPVRGTLQVTAALHEKRGSSGNLLLAERTMRNGGVRGCARTIPIAWDADVGNVKPTLLNGVLRLSIPKLSGNESARKKEKEKIQ